MTRQPLPRFRGDIQLVIDLSAMDQDEAERRMRAIADAVMARLDKSTFKRLAGKPEIVLAEPSSECVPQ